VTLLADLIGVISCLLTIRNLNLITSDNIRNKIKLACKTSESKLKVFLTGLTVINSILASRALEGLSIKIEPIVTLIAVPERLRGIIHDFKSNRLGFNRSLAVRNLWHALQTIRTEHERMVSKIIFRVIELVGVQLKVEIMALVTGING